MDINKLVEDLKDILTETGFASRWALVEQYHKVGERIREDKIEDITKFVEENLAPALNVKPRKIWYAVELYDKFPDLDKAPFGKNMTISMIIKQFLPKNPKEDNKEIKCRKCKLLNHCEKKE